MNYVFLGSWCHSTSFIPGQRVLLWQNYGICGCKCLPYSIVIFHIVFAMAHHDTIIYIIYSYGLLRNYLHRSTIETNQFGVWFTLHHGSWGTIKSVHGWFWLIWHPSRTRWSIMIILQQYSRAHLQGYCISFLIVLIIRRWTCTPFFLHVLCAQLPRRVIEPIWLCMLWFLTAKLIGPVRFCALSVIQISKLSEIFDMLNPILFIEDFFLC